MARDLKNGTDWLAKILSRLDRIESGSRLENASISQGRLRFIGGLLRLDSGARLEVVGTASIEGPVKISGGGGIEILGTGYLKGAGPFDWTGKETHKGDETHEGAITNTGTLTNNGVTKLNGQTDIAGKTNITGDTTLKANLIVDSGKITVGPITLDKTGEYAGQIRSGSYLEMTASTMMRMTTPMLWLTGRITAPNLSRAPKAGIASGGLWADANGVVYVAH